jgi:putative addiction module killer protein
MIEVRQTDLFANWLRKLRDEQVRARVQIRIRRLSLGNFGDVKPVVKA